MSKQISISLVLVFLIALFAPGSSQWLSSRQVNTVQYALAADPIDFAIITDYGTGYTAETTVANMVNSWSPDFIVTAGDNYQLSSDADVYPTYVGNYYGLGATPGRTDFINFGSTSNFWPVPGNHDYYAGGGELDRYVAYFSYLPPSTSYTGATAYYYDFVRGPVHFFMIDSGNADTSVPTYMTAQMTWLQNALTASTTRWQIVMFHQPAASAGSHGSKAEMDYDYGAWGADFVIGGHNHIYERINYRGIVHFTAGAGGGNQRTEYNTSYLPVGAVTQDYYNGSSYSGAMRVNATDTTITFQYITTDGTTQDEITYPQQAQACTTISLEAIADTYISSSNQNSNYGATNTLIVDGDPDYSALLKWDLASIPPGSIIDSASITLNVTNYSGDEYEIYQLLRNWVEGNNTSGSGADWIDYGTSADWGTAGAQGTNDRGSIILGSVGNVTTTGSFEFDLNSSGVDLIQDWLDGVSANYGIIIQDYTEEDSLQFSSSEVTTPSEHPLLKITYCEDLGPFIGDQVWSDLDADGIYDSQAASPNQEFPGGDVTVKLWSVGTNGFIGGGDDVLVQSTVSDRDASYHFYQVATGTYYIEFVSPNGYEFSPQNQGSDDSVDSDVDPNTGFTAAFAYTAGTTLDTIDAGFKAVQICYTLADQYADSNSNNDTLVKVDLLSGKGYYIGTADSTLNDGETLSINPYAADPANPFYTIDGNQLGTVNVNNGNFTDLPGTDSTMTCSPGGTTTYTITDMDGLAYRPGSADPGEWYASVRYSGNDLLVRLNPVNGNVVANAFGSGISCVRVDPPSGDTGLTDIDDLAFSADGSTLYGVANLNDTQSRIVVIDFSATSTAGDTIDRGEIQVGGNILEDVEGFSIDETGQAWAETGDQATTEQRDSLWRIDLTVNPIVATRIGTYYGNGTLIPLIDANGPDNEYSSTRSYEDYEGIACYGASSAGKKNVLSSIGNYVWLDEDGDGDQDAGERGIPNVTIQLWGPGVDGVIGNSDDSLLKTTVTDANGGYLFKDLPAGSYQVKIVTSQNALSLMTQTTHPVNTGDDFGNQNLPYTIVLPFSYENLTADFGFNYVSSTNTNDNTGTGAIGDSIWSDTDGDGVQDADEIGLPGVTVDLYTAGTDGLFGTADDVLYASTTTDSTGNYVFDNLPAGAYVVSVQTTPTGYTQTGDPDGILDNKTSAPILLAPGDVFVNADFGYQPPTNTTGTIGDFIFFDADGAGDFDVGTDYGIPGVTVSLIDDLDSDGIWDAGEPIIATDTTDASGAYSFSGLPTGDSADYLVWVNDTNNVLAGSDPTYDDDGISTPNISSVTNLTTSGVTDQDFGYAADGSTSGGPGSGLIGDTIWLNLDGDSVQDAGEPGIEGVVVELYASDGTTLLATTITDENGHYYFPKLIDATYVIKVADSNFTAGGVLEGLTETYDYDGTSTSNTSTVIVSGGAEVLSQDFGYTTPAESDASISGTLWEDTDADGALDGNETTYYAGVTIDLYNDLDGDGLLDPGEPLIGSTVTDANGDYSFTGLPAGDYIVDVTDTMGVLDGTTHTIGTDSKIDPYPVELVSGEDDTSADFGYYVDPATLGDFVWLDTNANGIQDAGELGIDGLTVTLTVTWPDASTTNVSTVTGDNPATTGVVETGWYSFDNLLLDEDLSSTTTSYMITVYFDENLYNSVLWNVGEDDSIDSDGIQNVNGQVQAGYEIDGIPISLVRGDTNTLYDFGLTQNPTNVDIYGFTAKSGLSGISLSWNAVGGSDLLGFNLYRALSLDAEKEKINPEIIPNQMPGALEVVPYTHLDTTFTTGILYYYWLEWIDLSGEPRQELYGPAEAGWWELFLPVLIR